MRTPIGEPRESVPFHCLDPLDIADWHVRCQDDPHHFVVIQMDQLRIA